MFSSDQYELVDFGEIEGSGFKLEKIGGVVVARPSPAASRSICQRPDAWKDWNLMYEYKGEIPTRESKEHKGSWKGKTTRRNPWTIRHGEVVFRLKTTPFGHLGVFFEQQANWDWIIQKVKAATRPVKVLNLFAYTGGATLAAASAGAEVVHIDAAKNVVQWARKNADLSGMKDKPVRWIAEDCSRFVQREIKRGNRYDAIILDPPSFGHGPQGEVWKIDRDLIRLLRNCRQLLSDSPEFLLLTSHSPGFGPAELQATLCDSIFGSCSTQVVAHNLTIPANDQRHLNAGCVARWPR